MRATPILRDNLGFGTLSPLVFSSFPFQTILDVLPHFLSHRPEQKLPLSSPPPQQYPAGFIFPHRALPRRHQRRHGRHIWYHRGLAKEQVD